MKAYIYKTRYYQGLGKDEADFYHKNVPEYEGRDTDRLECLGDVEVRECPLCKSEKIKVETESECHGFGDYTAVVCFTCKNCGLHAKFVNQLSPYDEYNILEAIDKWNQREED